MQVLGLCNMFLQLSLVRHIAIFTSAIVRSILVASPYLMEKHCEYYFRIF
jgi:hypothetical protein